MTNTSTEGCLHWLKQWFSQREGGSHLLELDKNYFEQGLVDSFGLLELIFSIEKEFKIKLTEHQFQDTRFSTIRGLAEIIQELKQSGSISSS